jgi:hypothetical protein
MWVGEDFVIPISSTFQELCVDVVAKIDLAVVFGRIKRIDTFSKSIVTIWFDLEGDNSDDLWKNVNYDVFLFSIADKVPAVTWTQYQQKNAHNPGENIKIPYVYPFLRLGVLICDEKLHI